MSAKDQRNLVHIFEVMGFIHRRAKHGNLYFHEEKGCKIQLPGTPGDVRGIRNCKSEFARLCQDNFTKEELEELLVKQIKKREVKLNEDGRVKLRRMPRTYFWNMRIEDEFKKYLLPELFEDLEIEPEYRASEEEKEEWLEMMIPELREKLEPELRGEDGRIKDKEI